jgi:hypothetical protein
VFDQSLRFWFLSQMKQRITFDTVRELAGQLAGAEESTSYGTPAFKVRGTLFLRLWEDNETLVVRTKMDRREEMISDDPTTYFLTDHYLNYPWVLVRLSKVRKDALRDLITGAWMLGNASKKSSTRSRR